MELVTKVGIETHFDASHHLPSYKGKCFNMHGHTWHIKVEVSGSINKVGMVVDLKLLKEAVKTITEKFDHKCVNDLVDNPTCEHLCEVFYWELKQFELDHGLTIETITIREGEGGWATLEVKNG
ncbi:MAG: 6-carboxytetrahydropterin synthase QueD [Eubacteriales bacterium]